MGLSWLTLNLLAFPVLWQNPTHLLKPNLLSQPHFLYF